MFISKRNLNPTRNQLIYRKKKLSFQRETQMSRWFISVQLT